MSHVVGIGLIGLGRHGRRYAAHLAEDLPGVRLAAVSRRHVEPISIGGREIPCHGDYRALIADPQVEAVVVVTPPRLNREIAVAVAQAGKPLLIEKPLALTAADARAIADAAAGSRQVMMTAQTLRFDAAIEALRERQALVGALEYLSLTSRMEPHGRDETADGFDGRGCLLEIGIHLLDVLRVLTGDEVERVSCEMDRVPPQGSERRVLGRLTTRRGVTCLLDVSRVSSGRIGRVELIGSEGQLSADWCARRVTLLSAKQTAGSWPVPAQPTVLSTLRAFIRSIREGVPPAVTIEDGRRAVDIAEACYRSAQQGGRAVGVDAR